MSRSSASCRGISSQARFVRARASKRLVLTGAPGHLNLRASPSLRFKCRAATGDVGTSVRVNRGLPRNLAAQLSGLGASGHLNLRASPSLRFRCRTATGDVGNLCVLCCRASSSLRRSARCVRAPESAGLSLPQIQVPDSNGRYGGVDLISSCLCAQASELEGLSLPQIQMPGSNGRCR